MSKIIKHSSFLSFNLTKFNLNTSRRVSCQHWILSLQLELAEVLWWNPQTWVWCPRSSRSCPSSYSRRMLSECCFRGQPFLVRWAWLFLTWHVLSNIHTVPDSTCFVIDCGSVSSVQCFPFMSAWGYHAYHWLKFVVFAHKTSPKSM